MICHKFYSNIEHIEPELHIPLEELLGQEIPNLEWLKEKDQCMPQDTGYGLFFDEKDQDRPVGFLRTVSRQLATPVKKSLLHRLLNPIPWQKWLNIQSPGISGHGLICRPEYEFPVIDKVLSMINTKVNGDYDLIQLTVPPHLSFDFPYRAKATRWKENNILDKKGKGYSDYFSSLPSPLRDQLHSEQKLLQSHPQYQIVSAQHLGGLWQKGQAHNALDQKIRHHPFMACYKNIAGKFLALCYDNRPLTIAVSLQGTQGQTFADIIFNIDSLVNSSFHHLILERVITEFYQSGQGQTLRFLNTLNWPQDLQRDLPSLQFSAGHSKTYIIPITGKKKKRSAHIRLGHEPRIGA